MRELPNNFSGFKLTEKNGVKALEIPVFTKAGFDRHCFTTRVGGVSGGEFASLNLSKTRENNEANKRENYRRVARFLGVEYDSLTLVNYSHGNGVYCANAHDAGKGIDKPVDYKSCDAIFTNTPTVTAVSLHADCTPVFMADPVKRVAGVGHAGWKGVYSGLVENMLAALKDVYGSAPQDILVGIGPHIMGCCFEVKDDVAKPFAGRFGEAVLAERDGGLFVDMQAAILMQLSAGGILPQNISLANMCTYCNEELFYSHRRDQGRTGAMGSFITV